MDNRLRLSPKGRGKTIASLTGVLLLALVARPAVLAAADQPNIPVLVPITGFLALEGGSQRNGALLALQHPPNGVLPRFAVSDTGVSPEVAVNALEEALGKGPVTAVVAPILGAQMLAMMPVALEHKVPLLTVSGTAQLTTQGNPYVFRFFPSDSVVKAAHARYVVEELHKTRPAILYQTTAYGQSGHQALDENFAKLGVTPVFEEGVDVTIKDFLPVLSRVKDANPDVLVIQLHAGPTALLVKQAAAMGLGLPIVAGSAMHQPATAALLEPAELKGVCAESAASPISGGSPEMDAFLAAYEKAFGSDPDAYALGQYDGTMMALIAIAGGAATPEALRDALAQTRYQGLAMTYKSDGHGNMAHSAIILCYDGASRTPRIVKRYDNLDGVL